MAVAFDVVGPSAAGQTASNPTSVTWSHTCTGSNRALLVFVGVGQNSGGDGTKTISGVTYAGVPMTPLGTRHTDDSTFGYLACYGLVAPASGANNVVVSFNSAPSVAECASESFTGVDQTTPFGTPVTAANDSATASAAVAANASTSIIGFGVCAGSDTATNPTSPATKRAQANFSHSSAGGCFGMATIPGTGSSVTCSWGITSDFWALIAVEVKQASAGTTLTVSNVGQTQSVQAVTLTQVHNLTVSGAGQAQHPTTPALTQLHQLATPSSVGQTQGVAATALTQVHNLTVTNVGQAQGVAATALTQVHQLATPSSVGQAQGVTATALTQVHQLAMSNVGQTQSVAAVGTMAQQSTLAPASETQTQSVQATALTQVHQMAVSGIGQVQGLTVPALVQTHVLAVAGVAQAQAPDTVALTQVHVLAVSGVGQAQHQASVTLSGPGTLAISDVGQGQLMSGPSLTQVHNLAVAGVHQNQAPGDSSPVAPGNLAVAGVGQSQTTIAVTLTQAHQLVAATVIQGQSIAALSLVQDHQLDVFGVEQVQTSSAVELDDDGGVLPPDWEVDGWLTLEDLMEARATHESIMLDTIGVRHPGMTEGVFDPDLGYAPATPRADYYTGKATVQARQISSGTITPAGLGTLTQLGYAVHGPVGSPIDQAAPDDIITVHESADPRHNGLVLIVRNVESSSFATARRLVCTLYEPSTP